MISYVTHVEQNGLVRNDIFMTRGDDGYIALPIFNADGSEYTVSNSDTVAAAVKAVLITSTANTTAATVIAGTVSVSDGLATWHIDSTDSDVDAGTYFWDAQITTGDGDVFTVYSGKFTIVGEVVV